MAAACIGFVLAADVQAFPTESPLRPPVTLALASNPAAVPSPDTAARQRTQAVVQAASPGPASVSTPLVQDLRYRMQSPQVRELQGMQSERQQQAAQ